LDKRDEERQKKQEENRQKDKKEQEENRQRDKTEIVEMLSQKLEQNQQKLEQNQQKLEKTLKRSQQEHSQGILEELRNNTAQLRTICDGNEKTTVESPTTEIVIDNNNEVEEEEEPQKEVNRTEPDDSMDGVDEEEEEEDEVEQEEDGKEEEEEEDKLQKRLWEEKAADPQTAEIVKINREPPVLVMVPNLASKCDVATLFCEVHSPHHLGKFHDRQYREVCQRIARKYNQKNLCHPKLSTFWKKAKHKIKSSKQNNTRRKKKVKVSRGLRFGSEAQIHKQRRSYQWQQSSNPYRKEVRDEGGTGKVDPLGQQIELVSY
jgi:hypothetical protein